MKENFPGHQFLVSLSRFEFFFIKIKSMFRKPKSRKYPFLCLKLLVDHTNRLVPHIVFTAWEILRETYQRKHPTTGQLKILKEKLPELSVLPHLMSSSIFRANLVTDEFLEGIANIGLDFYIIFYL